MLLIKIAHANADKGHKRLCSLKSLLTIPYRHEQLKELEMTTFFGFAIADSMFSGTITLARRELAMYEVKQVIEQGVEPCLNPSHQATIDAAYKRYGIEVQIPEAPPRVVLNVGDRLLVMGVCGLPRLTDRHEYTAEEIEGASFQFALYSVI